jgi:hypothetical protein
VDALSLSSRIQEELRDDTPQARTVLKAAMIVAAMERAGLKRYVDLGCWAGTLAWMVHSELKCRCLLIDGVKEFLVFAVGLFGGENQDLFFSNALLIPDNRGYLHSMRIDPNKTYNTNIFGAEGVELSVPRRVLTAGKLVADSVITKSDYLKVYLCPEPQVGTAGVFDFSFIKALFKAGGHPAVLHFEVRSATLYESFKKVLVQNGYFPPEIETGWVSTGVDTDTETAPRKQHDGWSVVCGPDFGFVLGLNPDKIYGLVVREEPLSWLKQNEQVLSKPQAGQ